jgi:hypothetical protein
LGTVTFKRDHHASRRSDSRRAGRDAAIRRPQIDQTDLDDIATYISSQRGAERFTGLPVVAGGPVPEGLYGWIAAGILSLFGFGFWSLDSKRSKGPSDAP